MAAGPQLGDIIVSVNGRSVADFTWDEEMNVDKLPSQTLVVAGSDGRTKTIKLEAKERWK